MTSTDKIPEDVLKAAAEFCRSRGVSPMDIPFHPTPSVLAVIDAIMAERTADKWQPIETAPKDMTEIIVLCGPKDIRLGWYFAPSSRTFGWRDQRQKEIKPTHWMPLPPLPAIRGGS